MIVIAILLHVFGDLAPKWILKKNYIDQNNYSWMYSVLKISGLVISFLFAFLLIAGITMTNKDRFIENKNAIYGLEFSETMKNFGFENGDKIVSINGHKIDRVSNIIKQIILESGEVQTEITRNENCKMLTIKEQDKFAIIRSGSIEHIKVKMQPDNINNSDFKKIEITELRFGFSKVFENFSNMWNHVILLISPRASAYNQIGGFIVFSNVDNIRGYLMILSLCSIFIGILNFIPLPGFDLGNCLISVLENIRRKRFEKRIIRVLQIVSVSLIATLILIKIYV